MTSITSSRVEEISPALPAVRWGSVVVNTIIVAAVILAALATLGRESGSAAHPNAASAGAIAPASESPHQQAD